MSDSDSLVEVDDLFARELEGLFVEWQPETVPHPELVAFNNELAAELGLDGDMIDSPEGAALLAGNTVPAGATPIAMAYAGHQFGGYSPRLGDGRAVLLGEVVDIEGKHHDLHLKGSGRTPFARGGDGKATLGPMLREFIMAEAIHALGIPTTRALAVATTGEQIMREGMAPRAILTRVASSHLRVGTFEYAVRLQDEEMIERLADHAISRHYPAAADTDNKYLALLEAVIEVQAKLVASWMLVGFIHGVLNTDNVTISGEGIDYGPCAFMDYYDPATVFSSIDRQGRYAYGNQPSITQWNLTRLAETLIPLIDEDEEVAAKLAIEKLETYADRFRHYWDEGMRAKLGLTSESDEDASLFEGLLALLHANRVDYTTSFRALSKLLRGDDALWKSLFEDSAAYESWIQRWQDRLGVEGRDATEAADEMDGINPLYLPRNELVEEALTAAEAGDLDPFRALLDVVTDPFVERPGLERFAQPASPTFDRSYQTFCGT